MLREKTRLYVGAERLIRVRVVIIGVGQRVGSYRCRYNKGVTLYVWSDGK